VLTVCEPKLRERTPQETFHFVESWASFSLKLGSGLGTGSAELGRLFFGVELLMSAFITDSLGEQIPLTPINSVQGELVSQ
jgi:hypothetical protein